MDITQGEPLVRVVAGDADPAAGLHGRAEPVAAGDLLDLGRAAIDLARRDREERESGTNVIPAALPEMQCAAVISTSPCALSIALALQLWKLVESLEYSAPTSETPVVDTDSGVDRLR